VAAWILLLERSGQPCPSSAGKFETRRRNRRENPWPRVTNARRHEDRSGRHSLDPQGHGASHGSGKAKLGYLLMKIFWAE